MSGTKLGRLLGVALVQAIGTGLGLLLFVVPGLLALTRLAVAVAVAMLEDRKTDDAIRRAETSVNGIVTTMVRRPETKMTLKTFQPLPVRSCFDRGPLVGLLTLVVTFMGTSLLQGALVEVVRMPAAASSGASNARRVDSRRCGSPTS